MNDATLADTAASIQQMAGLTFEPWRHDSGEWKPPSNEQWVALANPHLVSVRLAWLTLHKSKDELIAMFAELGDEPFMELVGQIGQSADWFESLHKLLESAECRLMCAYAAASMDADRTP